MIRYYRHKIAAAAKLITPEPQFSSEDVLELLMSVEELHGHKITAAELNDGSTEFKIGDCVYALVPKHRMVSV